MLLRKVLCHENSARVFLEPAIVLFFPEMKEPLRHVHPGSAISGFAALCDVFVLPVPFVLVVRRLSGLRSLPVLLFKSGLLACLAQEIDRGNQSTLRLTQKALAKGEQNSEMSEPDVTLGMNGSTNWWC